ncbi:MAG: FtsX-like permease family protein [Acidimicrobiia bacterium]
MLTTPPFRKAPRLLFKRRAVLFSVIGTSTILSIVAALTPLFVSSSASAALERDLEGRCPASFAGITTLFGTLPGREPQTMTDLIEENREIFREHVPTHPSLGEAEVILRGTVVNLSTGDGVPLTGRFVARDRFREHIELVEGEHGPGVYVDDVLAENLGVGPGETFTFTAGSRSSEATVQAVYAGLYDKVADDYWCSVQDVIETNAMGDLPPPPLLVDPGYFGDDGDMMDSVYAGYGTAAGIWEVPVIVDGLTVTEASEAAAILEEIDEIVVAASFEDTFFFQMNPGLHSDLLSVTERVQALTDALRSSILPLAGVVLIAATALIGGAGSYWVDRRRNELQYLSAVGAGPPMIATKAALEFFPAVILGTLIGWGAANMLIGLVGPSPSVESGARAVAIWVTAASALLGIIAVFLVVGFRARTLLDHRPSKTRRFRWRLPLLLLAVVGAVWVRVAIGESAVTIGENQLVGSVNPLVLFFPLFTFVAVVLLVAEIVIRAFPLLKRVRTGSHALYLALRRIVSGPTLVIALIAGAALPVATLIYAASLTRSATSTIDAKGRGFIGADISTPVYGLIDPPGDIAETSTVVIKTERVDLNGVTVDVLAVDRETFARGAYWDESYAEVPLDQILNTLAGEGVDGPLPAYVANGDVEDGTLTGAAGEAPIAIQGELSAFPGGRGSRPLIVVDRRRYVEAVADEQGRMRGSRYLMWTTDRTEAEVESAMGDAGIGFAFTVAAATTLDQLKFAAVVWTFDFLEIYAALAGMIAIGGILLYVDSRQRQRNLSYALARRMGLQRSEHLRAGVLELMGVTIVGTLAGLLAARIAAGALYKILDAVPETPPGPRWVGALDLSLLAIVIAMGVAAIAALVAQRTADSADTSELLRHGD